MSKTDRQNRVMITLSDYEVRMLTLWARIHGKPKSTYAAQIIGARVESNAELIRRELADIARTQGLTVEELEAEWLNDETDD